MVVNLLETFFRRPVVHLIPLFLLVAFGVFSAVNADKSYRSVGVLNATSGTLLSELTGNVPSFGFETSSAVTSRNLHQLLATDRFLDDVIRRAGLTTAVEQGFLTSGDIRASVGASTVGDNLIAVHATTPRPEQSQRLAAATLDSFVEYVVSNDIADATVRIDTYERIRDATYERYTEESEALTDYLLAHPAASDESGPITEQLEVNRLQANVARAESAYVSAEDNVNEAVLAADVARSVVERQLRVIDEPQIPVAPISGLRAMVMTVAVYAVLGVLLSIGSVVVAAALDRTIRTPDDVAAKLGLDVIAVVPSARRRLPTRQKKRAPAAKRKAS
jgi:capsular polysaccharide biosynthesis protein